MVFEAVKAISPIESTLCDISQAHILSVRYFDALLPQAGGVPADSTGAPQQSQCLARLNLLRFNFLDLRISF